MPSEHLLYEFIVSRSIQFSEILSRFYKMSSKVETTTTAPNAPGTLHFAKRGQLLKDESFAAASGVDAERMRARALLTVEQEKKLLRRIDWHIMPLCALMFLMKNLDATNVSLRSS